jgi:glutamate carboxypeptidase
MSELVEFFREKQGDTLALLEQLIEHETPTHDKARVDALGDFVVGWLEQHHPSSITRIPLADVGDVVVGRWNEDAPGEPIVVLMHMDTVWDVGTLAQRPIRTDDDGRLYAPGALDMKGGLAVAMTAVQGLLARGEMPNRPVWLVFTGDEETGSAHSEPHIREAAEQAALVLVMEPPTKEGALKTGRKGVASYTVEVTGRASHAGNHPEEGINAVLELAQQTVAISRLQDLRNGISVAVNTVQGGTATNVIPAHARATVDVRTFKQFDMDQVHDELTHLLPKIPGAKVTGTLNHMRGPMERDEQMIETFNRCREIARSIGVTVSEDIVGGASDANITASMGVPTLDGLGPRGEGLHADHEHIIVRSLPERCAHVAAMLRDWKV